MAKKRVYTYVEILWVCVRKELKTLLTMSSENGRNGNDFSDVYLIDYFVKEYRPYPDVFLQKFLNFFFVTMNFREFCLLKIALWPVFLSLLM